MKFHVISSNFQAQVEEICMNSEGVIETNEIICLDQVVSKYKSLMAKCEPFTIVTCDDGPQCIYFPKAGDHLIIMTEKQFNNYRREQMFAIQQQQKGRH